jgi:hypothetical protein
MHGRPLDRLFFSTAATKVSSRLVSSFFVMVRMLWDSAWVGGCRRPGFQLAELSPIERTEDFVNAATPAFHLINP